MGLSHEWTRVSVGPGPGPHSSKGRVWYTLTGVDFRLVQGSAPHYFSDPWRPPYWRTPTSFAKVKKLATWLIWPNVRHFSHPVVAENCSRYRRFPPVRDARSALGPGAFSACLRSLDCFRGGEGRGERKGLTDERGMGKGKGDGGYERGGDVGKDSTKFGNN